MADILLVHDHAHLRQSLANDVHLSGHTVFEADDIEQARIVSANAGDCAVVLIGTRRGERSAAVVGQAKSEWPTAEIVVIGHSSDLGEATEAVRHGAYDYVYLPMGPAKLGEVLRGALERRREHAETRRRPPQDAPDEPAVVDSATLTILARADRAAAVNSTVLITGESGTGKEVLARRIHRHSARHRSKFVPLNCGSLPETLVETELFGYKKGAFTGAVADSKGLIEEAGGGVLFLDEIGDTPLPMQVRLLRFLDSGEVRAVGGTSVKHVDVRVIAATNVCLRSAIRDKRFREDLFFRLRVVSLHLPPLRERRADIPGFVAHYTRRTSLKLGVTMPQVTDQTMSLLVRYDWPGNIRELQNVLEQALVQTSTGVITPQELPPEVRHGSNVVPGKFASSDEADGADGADGDEQLVAALRRYRGNRSAAAAALGISRTTLWRRLREIDAMTTSGAQGEVATGEAVS